MGDWLGTEIVAPQYRKKFWWSFERAKKYARKLKLNSTEEWRELSKQGLLPMEIPSKPYNAYKDRGWISWGDWLDSDRIATKDMNYRSFEEARKYVHTLKLKNRREWREFCQSGKLPKDIPKNPNQSYEKEGWKGVGDWLGTGRKKPGDIEFLPFEEAREFARSLNIKKHHDWVAFAKTADRPENIPASPSGVYADKGWNGIQDWLGTKKS